MQIIKHRGSIPFEEYLMTDEEASIEGALYTLSSGRLTLATGTTTPTFIGLKDQDAEDTSVTKVPVIRLNDDIELSATSTATVAASLVGEKVTIHTDGIKCTATTTSGVFTITKTDGATAVRGIFE